MNSLTLEGGGSARVLHEHFAGLIGALEWVSAAIDLFSLAILLVGAVRFMLGFVAAETRRDGTLRVRRVNAERVELGRYILAGLELFIVSDIIHTALSLALEDLIFLGVLVLIRSVISFFIDREMREIRLELAK
jgi:uncharacterized membrane protein